MPEFRVEGLSLTGKAVQGVIEAENPRAEKPVLGEQKAFTKEEVQDALSKMGFRVLSVKKKPFNLKLKPPTTEIVTFVRVSADLIRQKLPYNEILQLMVNDIENKSLRDG